MIELGGFHPDLLPNELQRWQGDGETGLSMKVKERGLRADYIQDALLHHFCGPDRLTVAYFQRRAFFQGVCNSFTQIRSNRNAGADVLDFYRRLRSGAISLVRDIRSKIVMKPNETYEVKKLIQKASDDGWFFHQNEVKDDPSLLAWIGRPNYFETDVRDPRQND